MNVSIYNRSENRKVWLNQDFNEASESFLVDNQPVALQDVYEKVRFEN